FFGTKSEWEQIGKELQTAAQGLGITIFHVELIPSNYAEAFARTVGDAGEAILASRNGLHFVNRRLAADTLIARRLPGLFAWRDITEAGGLMSYSADYSDTLRRAAGYVDKITEGSKARRLARPAADQVGAADQPQDCEGAWSFHTAHVACPRRRGDRIGRQNVCFWPITDATRRSV